MWKYLSTFLFVLICIGLEAAIQDQCGKGRCKLTSLKHVTCDTTAHFLSSCPPDAKVVDLSYDDVDQILDLHNKYRNKIASGQEAGFQPASKMPTIVNLYFLQLKTFPIKFHFFIGLESRSR